MTGHCAASRTSRLVAICFFPLFIAVSSNPAAAAAPKCPDHASGTVTREGNTIRLHCECDKGYVQDGSVCKPSLDLDVYQSTLADCRHLLYVRRLFRQKIEKMRELQSNTLRYQHEYEGMRGDALRGIYSDALDAIPIEGIAPKIVKAETAELAMAKIKAPWEAVKGSVSLIEGISQPENAGKFKSIADGELGVRNALLAIPLLHESPQIRKWLENLGNIYGAGVKLGAYALEWREGRVHRLPEEAELVGDIWGLYDPRVRMAVAGVKLVARGGQIYTAQWAVADLRRVLAQEWNAEQYLREKIQRMDLIIANENQLIDSYRVTNPKAASCGS